MKTVLLIGAFDKTDMIFYMAKLMSKHKKVLVVDVTRNQKYQYVYPKLEDTSDNIQQHDYFDIVENIKNYEALDFLLEGDDYDIALIDCDNKDAIKYWPECDFNFLVTSYENPVMQKNVQVMESFFREKPMSELIPFHKVIYEANSSLTEKTINESLDRFPIDWKETFIYYPDERDMKQKISNQYSSKVNFKGLSREYKNVIKEVVAIVSDTKMSVVNTIWKQIERSR